MKIQSKLPGAVLWASLLAFLLFVVYILCVNQMVFYTAHNRSEFLYGTPFLETLLSKPFGLMQYLGAWLTQFFYHPWLGTVILGTIWLLIFCVGKKAFRLSGNASALMLLPVACLLTSVVDLGYLIYLLPSRGYWFSQSLGYLLMLMLLWTARCTPRRWHIAWYLAGVCLYPVLGWFALLFVLCLILTEKPNWMELVGIVFLALTANLWHLLLYSNINLDAVMFAGFPRFVSALDSSKYFSTPFWVLAAVSVAIPLCARYLNRCVVPAVCAAVGMAFTVSLMFRDSNYIDEMRVVKLAEEDNWKGVLNVAKEVQKPTATIVMLRNVALMNEGGLLENSFKLGNASVPINNPDSLHVTFLEIAAPLAYYNYGILNESIRLNYENAIQEGMSPYYLKVLSRSTLATGETQLMKRFLTLLHHHPFYSNWQPAPVSDNVKELYNAYTDEITGIENSDRYLINHLSQLNNPDSRLASEQALFYSMIRCDSKRFWTSLRCFIKTHQNEAFPVSAQEAYIMYLDKSPEEKRMMLPVEQEVYDRYKRFWTILEQKAQPGTTLEMVGKDIRREWGDTYWYYNIFGRR